MVQNTEVFAAVNDKSLKPSLPENPTHSYSQKKNSRQIQNFFNKAKNLLIYIFCAVQVANLKLFRQFCKSKQKPISRLQFVQNMGINKYFGLIEETIVVSCIF